MNEQNQTEDTTADANDLLDTPLPTDEVEQEVTEEPKAEEPQGETEEVVEELAEEKPKKKVSGFTRRLNRERDARAKAEARAQELEDRLAAQQKPKSETKSGEPDPTGYEHGINDINYIKDMARHEGEQAFYKTQKKAKEDDVQKAYASTMQKANDNFEEKLAEAADRYEDFDEVFHSNRVDLDPSVLHAVKSSDIAGDLTYKLLKDKKLASKIANMNNVDGIRAIGRLEAKLTASPKSGKSKMPAPVKTVGDGKTKQKRAYSDDMSQEEFNDSFSFSDLDTL